MLPPTIASAPKWKRVAYITPDGPSLDMNSACAGCHMVDGLVPFIAFREQGI